MNNSANSFNICPRCGNSNSLNAKFCSRCGAQLKVPEEAVICPKCHTRNTSVSNFCRSCGTSLHKGNPTKICPKCGRELSVETKSCECGYVFVASKADEHTKKPKKEKVKKERVKKERVRKEKAPKVKKLYNHQGGRKIAVFALIFLVILTVLVTLPANLRWKLADLDKGVINVVVGTAPQADEDTAPPQGNTDGEQTDEEETKVPTDNIYVYDIVKKVVDVVMQKFGEEGADMNVIEALGGVSYLLVDIAVILFALMVVVLFFVYFIRIFAKKRPRAGKWFVLVITLITTILLGLVFGASFILEDSPSWIAWLSALSLPEGHSFGWVAAGLAFEIWFFFLYTFATRARVMDEDTLDEDYDEDDEEY